MKLIRRYVIKYGQLTPEGIISFLYKNNINLIYKKTGEKAKEVIASGVFIHEKKEGEKDGF